MKNVLKDWGWLFALAVFVLFLRLFVISPYTVHGASMEPSFHDGDRVMAAKWGRPDYGDVVIIHREYTEGRSHLIKRVIGLPGDVIEIRDGVVYRNGQALDEPYIKEPFREDLAPVLVPDGHAFVMGDNRHDSLDSRHIGTISLSEISGIYLFRFWPLF
jgi:signal peptidase I